MVIFGLSMVMLTLGERVWRWPGVVRSVFSAGGVEVCS